MIDISNIKNLNSQIKDGVKEAKGENVTDRDAEESEEEEEPANPIYKKAEAKFFAEDKELRTEVQTANERVKAKMIQLQGMVEQ